jgi:hypothetical protein
VNVAKLGSKAGNFVSKKERERGWRERERERGRGRERQRQRQRQRVTETETETENCAKLTGYSWSAKVLFIKYYIYYSGRHLMGSRIIGSIG